jgi:hypothetical protein
MAAGALSLTASVGDLPATPKEAELESTRLGAGQLAAHIEQAAGLLARGELDSSHPWPAALVWRRVRDLHGVETLASDGVLAPLLDLPCAADVLHALAPKDPSGTLDRLADALAPHLDDEYLDELAGRRRFVEEQTDRIVARYAGVSTDEVARIRRARQLRRAAAGLPPDFTQAELAGYQSRRSLQARRRRIGAYVARTDGTQPPPEGKGRWPGSKGTRTLQRRRDLAERWPALSADERRPAALAERYGVSLATAKRDATAVRTGSI